MVVICVKALIDWFEKLWNWFDIVCGFCILYVSMMLQCMLKNLFSKQKSKH